MKKTLLAVCAMAALCASAVPKWKNLDDKSHLFGEKISSEDLLGNVVLVYYWDVSEENSLKLLTDVEKVWNSFKTKKFRVVGNYVGKDDAAKVKAAAEKHKVTFPVYRQFTLDPDPKPGWGKAPFFCVVNHRGTALYTGGGSKEGTEKVVEAISSIGMPVSMCGDVEFKKFKGLAGQLKLGKNVTNIMKTLEKKKADKDPNVASEAQDILSAIDDAMSDVKTDIEIFKESDPAEAIKVIQLFIKTWPKDDAVAEFKEMIPELKEKAKEKLKADKAKAKEKAKEK